MAVNLNGRRRTTTRKEFQLDYKDREKSPERTEDVIIERKVVPVVYYLSRNGLLEHPHFIEVPLASPTHGLYLKDVINRLNILRGKGIASMYSWSSKRTYKNGFVWHDLSENDFIHSAHGCNEYVLKGSELLERSLSFSSSSRSHHHETVSSSSTTSSGKLVVGVEVETTQKIERNRRRNQSWSSIDLNEYKVHKTANADASTQTDDKRRRRRTTTILKDHEEQEEEEEVVIISPPPPPPPLSSSPETLESLMKEADDGEINNKKKVIIEEYCGDDDGGGGGADIRNQSVKNNYPSGRSKASAVLMQLISCGSISFNNINNETRLTPPPPPPPPPRGTRDEKIGMGGEDKEYFSGSLIETNKNKDEYPALKRSSSDRGLKQLELVEKEREEEEELGVRSNCMALPRKSIKKQDNVVI
ncbi:hypothetical protein AQUCO_01000691v1 [Aquilegia coerulea]|uniref:SOSEKI DIX-like domain-containing protein n=1 Tax=Aquilegia coerulea TaxID=218851 RepID=A0A2G5EB67_AQUCA|nr:hypothetical protein AQUCO_01000691v1 [Aquilegia coerulea]